MDTEGRVSRCEHPQAGAFEESTFQCKCAALRTFDFGAGDDGRRVQLDLGAIYRDDSHLPVGMMVFRQVGISRVKASDPSVLLGTEVVNQVALNQCAASVAAPRDRVRLSVRLAVGEDGRIRSHSMESSSLIPEDVRACISDVFERTRLRCPVTGESSIDATIRVAVDGDSSGD